MGGLGYVSGGVPFFTPFLIPISTFLPCKSSNANLPHKAGRVPGRADPKRTREAWGGFRASGLADELACRAMGLWGRASGLGL